MAKSNAPLFGIDAAGALGNTVVYAKWRGVKYARRYVVPANPRTAEQMLTRDVFSFLNQLWVQMPSLGKAPWAAYASGRPMTDRNAFIKFNIPQLRTATNLGGFVASPGVLGGFPLAGFTATGDTGQATASAVVPSLPPGWTVQAVIFEVISDQDPHDDFGGVILAQEDTTEPYSVTFTGLSAGSYVISAWARYARPDGKIAYGPSLIATVTVS